MAFGIERVAVNYTLSDEGDTSSTFSVSLPKPLAFADLGDYATFFISMAGLLDPLTDARLAQGSLVVSFYDDAALAPGVNSNVEKKGRFNFETAGNKIIQMAIPSVLDSLLMGCGGFKPGELDLTNLAVTAFVDAVLNGLGTPAIIPTDTNGRDLLAVVSAYQQHTRSHMSPRVRKG